MPDECRHFDPAEYDNGITVGLRHEDTSQRLDQQEDIEADMHNL
ncbi:hypothetical protein [Desulfosarcina variabilis]